MKYQIIFFLLGSVACQAQTSIQQGPKLRTLESERLKLKNDAFCICMNKVYPGIDKAYNDGSAAGYFETSAYGISAFEVLNEMADQFAKKEYKSKDSKKLGMMKCLDFYNSRELESAIIRLDSVLDFRKLNK